MVTFSIDNGDDITIWEGEMAFIPRIGEAFGFTHMDKIFRVSDLCYVFDVGQLVHISIKGYEMPDDEEPAMHNT